MNKKETKDLKIGIMANFFTPLPQVQLCLECVKDSTL